VYPAFARDDRRWLDPAVRPAVLRQMDSEGFARRDAWVPGEEHPVPEVERALMSRAPAQAEVSTDLRAIVDRCLSGDEPRPAEVARLFQARGIDFAWVVSRADDLRRRRCGDTVSYVVNRNINYTNVCYFKCQFCAFSKGRHSEELRGRPYDISADEIAARSREAWNRGATEVCMQGGIHPDYTGQTYLDILHTVRAAAPNIHVHAFSPLEVWQGARTLGVDLEDFLQQLREAGLGTLPGTAAEVLHDDVRRELCADKLTTGQWMQVMEAAHAAGLRTTATIMYGHIDRPIHWAHHLLHIRRLQQRSGGFTEFVPLPFVHMEAPIYRKGNARRGPSFREAVLMHAVARLVFNGLIDNIQTSWVKMGAQGVRACLNAGANDLGGTLMNESITRAAGSGFGQEWPPAVMVARIREMGRVPRMRDTLYRDVSNERSRAAFAAPELIPVANAAAGKRQRSKRLAPVELHPVAPPQEELLFQRVLLMAACN
jgi:FO synthase